MFNLLGYFTSWSIKRLLAEAVDEKQRDLNPELLKRIIDSTYE
jgi:hypothetical protein